MMEVDVKLLQAHEQLAIDNSLKALLADQLQLSIWFSFEWAFWTLLQEMKIKVFGPLHDINYLQQN